MKEILKYCFFVDVTGPMTKDSHIAIGVIQELSKLALVYASYGNHELDYEKNFDSDLKEAFEAAGAKMLEYSYEDIEVNGQSIRIGGLFGYCVPISTHEAREHEVEYLEEFASTDAYTLLLTHMPYCWIANDAISEWNVDCVFAGHDHGGQIHILLIGGLYAPDQGWFREETVGFIIQKK